MSAEWRHESEEWTADAPRCRGCGQSWPCDAERMRVERDAATRRAEEAEAVLRNLVDNDTDHFDYEGSKAVPPHDDDRALDDCRECYRIRLGWIDAARAVLRSQESQKPPETER